MLHVFFFVNSNPFLFSPRYFLVFSELLTGTKVVNLLAQKICSLTKTMEINSRCSDEQSSSTVHNLLPESPLVRQMEAVSIEEKLIIEKKHLIGAKEAVDDHLIRELKRHVSLAEERVIVRELLLTLATEDVAEAEATVDMCCKMLELEPPMKDHLEVMKEHYSKCLTLKKDILIGATEDVERAKRSLEMCKDILCTALLNGKDLN